MPIRMSGLMSGMDTEAIVNELMSAQSLKKTKVVQAKTKLEWKQTKWADLNTKLTKLYNNFVSKMQLSTAYKTKKATLSDDSKAKVSAGINAVNGNYTMEVTNIATSQYLTGAVLGAKSGSAKISELDPSFETGEELTIKTASGTKKFTVGKDTTIDDFTKALRSAGLNASYDTDQKRLFISSKETGKSNAFSITGADASTKSKALEALGLTNITADVSLNEEGKVEGAPAGMELIKASDSEIILNGAKLTSSTATVSANGLSIELVGKTKPGEQITFSVSNDVDGIYDSIKGFLNEYNEVMKEMNTLYNADSSKGYEPLTNEEKEAMTEEDVKLWEDKIKDSLLRHDSTLNGIIQGMRSAMMSTVSYEGKTYALSSFGIMTSTDYKEGGLLHIYGDPDDSVYSSQDDKLKKAIADDPDALIATLTDVFGNLRKVMSEKMAGSKYSSALTFYDDIKMKDDVKQYEKDIKGWEDKLATIEESYYKKFTAMETALAKLQSQQSYMSNLFGNNS